ncbi:uncharacterized protein LOC131675596 [Phymastichus coffea]|uniref:uncharacterized protein LOC131675596 n=1 Tax=Phymastichus coffea TaxID=108790 RepID=UPI00273B1607|nr:uncharacterized protein LOC131675596 [Phymastichus coffea]
MTGTKRIHTTPYHPQSNGLVERLHRTLKAALMCDGSAPWPDRLPLILLGLRTCYKEDLEASPAELLFGTTLRIPGEFFVEQSISANLPAFVARLRAVMNLKACSHVFQRIDSVRKPLQPPYFGPHEVVRRLDDKVYVIKVNGQEKTVSTDALKPAYLDEENLEPQQLLPLSHPLPPQRLSSQAPTQLLPPQALSHQRPFEPEH